MTIRSNKIRIRKQATTKIITFSQELTIPLGSVLQTFENLLRKKTHMHHFERTLVELTLRNMEREGYGTLESALNPVKKLRKNTSLLAKAAAAECAKSESTREAVAKSEASIAEIGKLWESSAWSLQTLQTFGRGLRSLSVPDMTVPMVVLVGSPNVGKSSIIRAVSSGKPEVNNYPFTTRGMSIGHVVDPDHGGHIMQVMDTPGVLVRAEEERNLMEALTLACIQYLPSAVVFVIDLSGESGRLSTVANQLQVRDELRSRFPDRPWLDVITKADLPHVDMEPDVAAR